MSTPEQRARETIDHLLEQAGWTVQDRTDFNRSAATGMAVREFSLPNGAADYLLFVDGKAAGVIEAKKRGVTLSGVADQSAKYMNALPEHLASWDKTLRYEYESTGEETYFCDQRDPKIHDDPDYNAKDLVRSAVNPNQIHTILKIGKERVFTGLFPDRSGDWLPQALIFAKDVPDHFKKPVHN